MANIIDGKKIAEEYKTEIKVLVDELKMANKQIPCLAAIIAGNDGGSHYYLNSVIKNCNLLGIQTEVKKYDESVTEDELIEAIKSMNKDDKIHGIMLFLPLPKGIDEKRASSAISYKKDVDCLTDINNGKFYKGEKSFKPCTAQSVVNLAKSTGITLEGKNVVIIGRSNIVGKPTAQLMLNENATITICHSKTKNLVEICKRADILVSCIGKANFITGEYIKEGAIVIDVGTSSLNGKITGDVLFQEASEKASFITPVPGGVGAVTTTLLIKNVCEAFLNVY